MKTFPTRALTLAAVGSLSLIAITLPAKAAIGITEVANPTDTKEFYGVADDYVLFNNTQGTDTESLTDFSATTYTNPRDNPGTTTIDNPAGTSESSGIVWQFGGDGGVLAFTLTGSGSSSFDYSDFYLTVLYNNISGSTTAYNDTALTLAEGTVPDTSDAYTVADVTTGLDAGDVAEFHITGAAEGEIFYMNALSANADVHDGNMIGIGGLSISQTAVSVPEPSTWAMMGAGLATLFFFVRRRAVKA